jgi:probable rRNA maturation factor
MADGDQRARLRAVVVDAHGRSVKAPGVARWLVRVAPAAARGTVSIALVSDARVRALNRRYRGKDYATDVLSFPAEASSPPTSSSQTTRGTRSANPVGASPDASLSRRTTRSNADSFLGDIVIARGVVRRQARAAGHSDLTELRVLALHGLLHLLGYDHQSDQGRMRRLEVRLRRKGRLREGLIERASSRPRARARR